MTYILTGKDEPAPDGYSPAPHPTIPGADWYIEGRRYRETGRTPTEDGYTMTLEPADSDELLGYITREEL